MANRFAPALVVAIAALGCAVTTPEKAVTPAAPTVATPTVAPPAVAAPSSTADPRQALFSVCGPGDWIGSYSGKADLWALGERGSQRDVNTTIHISRGRSGPLDVMAFVAGSRVCTRFVGLDPEARCTVSGTQDMGSTRTEYSLSVREDTLSGTFRHLTTGQGPARLQETWDITAIRQRRRGKAP